MTGRHQQRILTIPAGLPFLKTLAAALCDGRLTDHFRHDPGDPLSLAKVSIFLPTRRAVRVLRSEFVDLLGGSSAILPVIRALGETDDDSGYFEEALPETADLAQPLANTARLLELARLILAWRNKLPQIVRDIHSDSPLVAPASPPMPYGSRAILPNSSIHSRPRIASGASLPRLARKNMRCGGS